MKLILTLICLLSMSLTSLADCGGVCVPGPGTPDYAVGSCKMVNSFPLSIRAQTCVNANGCDWRQAQEVDVCVPGPGTPSYAESSCKMVNSFPLSIREQTCLNANGCVMQTMCH